MSDPDSAFPSPSEISAAKLAALSPEDRRRIGTAMRYLVDLKTLHNDGLQIASDLLEGKTPAVEVGMKLVDLERSLRVAANEMLQRPLRVIHSEALRKGQTKLDFEPWLMRVRIKANEARTAREDEAREERFKGPPGDPATKESVPEEAEPGDSMRP